MKLYVTTTSERASKGQGGNEYLVIKLQMLDENKEIQPFCKLYYHINESGEYELLNEETDEIIYIKGKKRKTDI
jgi:hypothetical protein